MVLPNRSVAELAQTEIELSETQFESNQTQLGTKKTQLRNTADQDRELSYDLPEQRRGCICWLVKGGKCVSRQRKLELFSASCKDCGRVFEITPGSPCKCQ